MIALAGVILCAGEAKADLYKYKKKDGTVVYTDNLGQLPPDRRDFYNKQREEREAKRQQLERELGKDEVARREAEAQKAALARAEMEEQERQQRLAAIDAVLEEIKRKSKDRDASREAWRQRMRAAQEKLQKLLAEFNAASTKYNELAIKPSFTLLPGQSEELETAKKDMERLEQEVDAAIEEVEVTIPEEARKAGIPPGFLR
jgi:hypothetical protein